MSFAVIPSEIEKVKLSKREVKVVGENVKRR